MRSATFELLSSRAVLLTPRTSDALTVQRFLPSRSRRMIGAWCFVDFYGPSDVSTERGMQVPPHPHCGLQTVSWLLAGEISHRDSLGNSQLIEPGQLNLMTSGLGISHAEYSTEPHGPILHGVQLWVALPDAARSQPPAFEHHRALPRWRRSDITATVFIGHLDQVASPATTFSPLLGAEINVPLGSLADLPLEPHWEYGLLVTDGSIVVNGERMHRGEMVYLGSGGSELTLAGDASNDPSVADGGRALLLGGEPFAEPIVMWWNFVTRSHDEVVQARADWAEGSRFGVVRDGEIVLPALPAPPIPPVIMKPR